MVKYRTLRLKMKGGKTRLQRALVLASGKLRFVKNKGLARHTSHKTTKKHRSKGGIVRMARWRRGRKGHHGKSAAAGIEKAAITVAFIAPMIGRAIGGGDTKAKVNGVIMDYTGYNCLDHSWNMGALINGWGPGVTATIAAKVMHKIIGIVRRI